MSGVLWAPSPNYGPRRGDARPDMVVLHYTAMSDAGRARAWLSNPESQVSAHYLIGRDGTVWQLVSEALRAWHAGAGRWGNVRDVNSRSIGIELDNDGASEFEAPQMAALETLLAGILRRWSIPPERVIGHSDLAPGRKIDPGPLFDWDRLARAGLAAAATAPRSAMSFEDALTAMGYDPDLPPETRLHAFRLRFRKGAQGPVGETDLRIAQAMAAAYPVLA